MASKARQSALVNDWLKFSFFALIGICFLSVLWVDDRFWFDPSDPHARRVLAFRSLLMFHGLTGLTALTAGTLQMSSRIRTLKPALHHSLGKVYIIAVCLSAPMAIYIGVSVAVKPRTAFRAVPAGRRPRVMGYDVTTRWNETELAAREKAVRISSRAWRRNDVSRKRRPPAPLPLLDQRADGNVVQFKRPRRFAELRRLSGADD